MEANLSNCSECHSCYAHRSPARQHDVPPALPTRVLKVGRKPEDIRLLDGRNSHGHYICLSYCWGSVQPLTTTVANLGNHLTSIPWGTLPRLYKDTVRLAWRFGIEFVWIDSLCILQDDRDDWEREAGRMCDVYGNAWLTIAATSSRNCREGILNNPLSGDSVDSFLSSNRLVKWSGSNAANGVEWIAIPQPAQSSSGRHLKVKPEEQEMFPETWPLLTRAWVLQERILSPRVLHFATPELWFECKEEVRCECSGAHLSGPSQIGFGRRIQKPLEKGDAKELGKLWQELVEEYTKLYLTKEEDRLPALSGLAQRFSRAMPGVEYLAGLWGNSFPEGLAWYKESTVEETRQSQAIQGMIPSWSWAASPGPVKFPSTGPFNFWSTHVKARCDPHSNVVRAQCQPMTPSPAGLTERVRGESLCVQGLIIDVVGNWCRCELGLKHLSGEWLGHTEAWYDDHRIFQRTGDFNPLRFCLLWLYGFQNHEYGNIYSHACALLLQAVGSAAPELTYRRVGLIRATSSEGPGPLELHGTRDATLTIV